ncbi:MAG: hypothetical protein NC408_09645 [Candidatus Gastranaerophilales bacterium]|nr:hypothetical protein [Candidatus Gastranaerophilales bacterium]MCM1074007.1 hypothetical protein [Bacteroides sp.]
MDEAVQAVIDLLLSCIDSVISWFSDFFIDKFSFFIEHAEKNGSLVLNRLFSFCASLDYADFLALFVGFIFSIYAFEKAIHLIRG